MAANATNDMMQSYFNSDPTNFEETPFHIITTNHPYMATLGLSQFTTGTLYRWWNKKDAQGNYVNHKYFAENPDTIQNKTCPELLLLGNEQGDFKDKQGKGADQFSFQAWRKEGNAGAGQYIKKYADDGSWDFSQPGLNEAGRPRTYDITQVDLTQYNDKFYSPSAVDGTPALNSEFDIIDGKGKSETVKFKSIWPITNAIVLNDDVNFYEYESATKTEWDDKRFARQEFILDIQTSKSQGGGLGYIEWSGYVPFYLSLAQGESGDTFKCEKGDWVVYRLYLYPNSSPKSSRRGLAMAKPVFAAPPVDSLGRKYQHREDGRFSAFPEGSQAAEVVGELDMSYNEYTGKWEAGSKQMVAVVTQTIPRAQILSAERLRNLPPEEMLKNPSDPNSHIIFGSGAAMPLNMQNGNPMQWTPNYAQASETDSAGKFNIICPKETEAKATLLVFNASSKEIPTDQYVLLNQIDGIWFAIDFPSGIEAATTVQPGFDGKWDFTYLATNFVHFFRDNQFNKIDPDYVWQGFHRKYYKGDSLNENTYIRTLTDANNTSFEWTIDYINLNAFHQFTSFDFMDAKIGGTREKNAIALTNPIIAPNGETIEGSEQYETQGNGLATGGFFGCIFPDGYNIDQLAEYKVARNFNAAPAIAYRDDSPNIYPHGTTTFINGTVANAIYLTEIDKSILPFADAANRNDYVEGFKDASEIIITMFDDTKLTNLPADIATNAAPSGKNGQPIKNIHTVGEMYGKTNAFLPFSFGQNWLYRKTEVVPTPSLLMESSAFDFAPVAPNKIMFRPLKAETYSQFIATDYTANERKTRDYFCHALTSTMFSKKRAASDISKAREYNYNVGWTPNDRICHFPNVQGEMYTLYNSHWGLQCNIDIPAKATGIYNISPRASFETGNNSKRFDNSAWGRDQNYWCYGGEPGDNDKYHAGLKFPWRNQNAELECEPAGAVGIIGAVATCTANTNIKFQTDNRLGSWSWAYLRGINLPVQGPTWGNGDNYNDLNTTNLFVKIYQHWPREQIVYDPRYFAVHHFNPGIQDGEKYYTNISVKEESITQIINNVSQTYKYLIPVAKYDVDIRLPSCLSRTPSAGTNEPLGLNVNARIYGTKALVGQLSHDGLSKSKWIIDPKRRAKLLPYKYICKSVRIPKVIVTLPSYSDGFDNDGNEVIYKNGGYAIKLDGTPIPFYDKNDPTKESKKFNPFTTAGDDIVMIVKNPGNKGYKIGDTFTCSDKLGANLIITILELDGDRVKKFEVTDQGYDFSYNGFPAIDETKPITMSTAGIPIFTGGSQKSSGEGFSVSLIRGVVAEIQLEDLKPAIATSSDHNLISMKSNKQTESGSGSTALGNAVPGTPFGLDADKFEADIEITNASKNKKYDLFFFFHNDISHTFMQPWNGNIARWNNEEQYIDLTITTN